MRKKRYVLKRVSRYKSEKPRRAKRFFLGDECNKNCFVSTEICRVKNLLYFDFIMFYYLLGFERISLNNLYITLYAIRFDLCWTLGCKLQTYTARCCVNLTITVIDCIIGFNFIYQFKEIEFFTPF